MKDLLHPDPIFNLLSNFNEEEGFTGELIKFAGVQVTEGEDGKLNIKSTPTMVSAIEKGYVVLAATYKGEDDTAIFRITEKGIEYKKALRSARDN